ncbi:MAG: hypothetical protein Q8O89_01040 [Nanoarchaeota archaeon]|nr:hypothetical protein [Nanoarchaeota archaeon]
MIDYNIIKHCRGCRARFVVSKGESKKNYCDACQKRYMSEQKNSKE